jgi:Carbohydrate family 9 binding domain-like
VRAAPWSEPFIDIDGVARPRLATRAKMLWDDSFLYIAAELEEPDIWATLNARDSVIFQDNDFEVFIDPDGEGLDFKPSVQVTDSLFEIRAAGFDGAVVHIRQDGKVWVISRPAAP